MRVVAWPVNQFTSNADAQRRSPADCPLNCACQAHWEACLLAEPNFCPTPPSPCCSAKRQPECGVAAPPAGAAAPGGGSIRRLLQLPGGSVVCLCVRLVTPAALRCCSAGTARRSGPFVMRNVQRFRHQARTKPPLLPSSSDVLMHNSPVEAAIQRLEALEGAFAALSRAAGPCHRSGRGTPDLVALNMVRLSLDVIPSNKELTHVSKSNKECVLGIRLACWAGGHRRLLDGPYAWACEWHQ